MNTYLKTTVFTYVDGSWSINDTKISDWVVMRPLCLTDRNCDSMFTLVVHFLHDYGVEDSLRNMCTASNYWNEQIIRHWVDELIRNVGGALWREVFKNTAGPEKEKFKAADRIYAEYEKVFK